MNSFPTLIEYNAKILEQCQTILYYIDRGSLDIKNLIDSTFESTKMLINALDMCDKSNLLDRLEKFKRNDNMIKLLVSNIQKICFLVIEQQQKKPTYSRFFREEQRIHGNQQTNLDWPDQIDEKAYWFRKYFVGKPYITLTGPFLENDNEFAIFSIVKEVVSKGCSQFRIIVRTKQDSNMGFIVDEKDANELIFQLEFLNQAYLLELESDTKRHRPLRSFSSAIITGMTHHVPEPSPTRIMRASLLFLFQQINFKLFKEFSAETTIMLGLEKEFLKYDEIGIPKSYKFGVLTVQQGQTTEEEWFANNKLSKELNRFLNIMARPVKLKGYKGYAAGLDTKTGESGETSFVSQWKDHEIMFHVAPLMPTRENDSQQVHRKRHIGNDIVCIIFIEDKNSAFNPESIRSQFLHVFIIVYFAIIDQKETWRIEVLHDKGVKPFSPPLPSPPVFHNEQDLRNFLILKLINAENASLKSEKFLLPNNKARLCILKSLIETGLDAVTRTYSNNDGKSQGERPKSAGSIRNSFKVVEYRPTSPELPPVPAISRSNMLRDIKSLTRRKSSGQQRRNSACTSSATSLAKIPDELQQDCHIINEESTNDAGVVMENNSMATSGIRYKAQNLVSSMIGRRNSRNSRTVSS